jgi:nucleotide-binding universal stress UspA family protein
MALSAENQAYTGGALPSFTRILLVTDFSSYSVAAAPFARVLAERYNAALLVAHVISTEMELPTGTEPENQGREEVETEMRNFLAQNSLSEVVEEAVVEWGPVWDTIANVIRDKEIDLVVLGTHGRSGVNKLVVGSIAQRIFGLASCPVLTVSPRAQDLWGREGKLGTVFYATDFSADSLKALPYALSAAKMDDADLLLLHVQEPSHTGAIRPEVIERLHEQLNALLPPEVKKWCRYDTFVVVGEPSSVILEAAAERNPGLIVIGGHPRSGPLSQIEVPLSISYRIVAHAHCPVLRVRST